MHTQGTGYSPSPSSSLTGSVPCPNPVPNPALDPCIAHRLHPDSIIELMNWMYEWFTFFSIIWTSVVCTQGGRGFDIFKGRGNGKQACAINICVMLCPGTCTSHISRSQGPHSTVLHSALCNYLALSSTPYLHQAIDLKSELCIVSEWCTWHMNVWVFVALYVMLGYQAT